MAIVLTAVASAIATFFAVTEEGRLLLKILYYRTFPKLAEQELGRMVALVDNVRKCVDECDPPIDYLIKRLRPLGLEPPTIFGVPLGSQRLKKELDYLWWLAREPQHLHLFGRKSLNDPSGDLDFAADKLHHIYWKRLVAGKEQE